METDKVATGGTVTRVGLTSRLVHTFTESGEFIVNRPVHVRYVIVGGVGGYDGAGGEVKRGAFADYLQPGRYVVTVGKPGATDSTSRPGSCRDVSASCRTAVSGARLCGGSPQVVSTQLQSYQGKSGTPSTFAGVEALGGRGSNGSEQQIMRDAPTDSIYYHPQGWPSEWYTTLQHKPHASYLNNVYRPLQLCRTELVKGSPPNDLNPTSDDITGESVTYGTKTTSGIVIISYESTVGAAPPATPSPDTIAQIEKAYAEKMQKLKDALEAEKRALEAQNAAAAAEASKLKDQLFSDLTGLKAQYEQLKATVSSTTGQLDATKRDIAELKSEYDMKMVELKRAQQTELDAISTNNREAIDAARSAKETLVRELTALKVAYDTIVALSKQCPIIPEGAIVVDSKTGVMFKYEAGVLRGISAETYGALGKPKYTLFKPGALDNCPRGPDITIETVAPKPVDEPVAEPKFPSTAYVIAHAESWEMNGELRVLAARFGGVVIEPFEFKEYAQLFVINSTGYVRNLNGDGAYMSSTEKCLAPSMSKTVPRTGWKLRKTGESQYTYTLIAECGVSIKAGPSDRSAVLEKSVFGGDASDEWYVIPVGRVEF